MAAVYRVSAEATEPVLPVALRAGAEETPSVSRPAPSPALTMLSPPKLDVPTRLLHGPGPSPVAPSVLEALARPCIGHMDPEFMRVMNEVREMLQQAFRTENPMTLACSGTGSAGAEMLMDNLVEPGDVCLVGINGVFGGRLTDKAKRAGGVVRNMTADWGSVFDQDAILEKIEELKPKLVAFVHAETSTGAHQPFKPLGGRDAQARRPVGDGLRHLVHRAAG